MTSTKHAIYTDIMKRFLHPGIFALILLLSGLKAEAQIYDGITQPTAYRVWASITQPTDGGSTSFSFFTGYKHDVADWFSVTGVASYNVTAQAFSPAVWLNFNAGGVFYVLSRNIWDVRSGKFKETLSATVKIPHGFMVDATWDNMFDGGRFADGDRLQVVGGWGGKHVVMNAGYSLRAAPGFIANVRFKLTQAYWLQFKYDGGLKAVAVNMAYHF